MNSEITLEQVVTFKKMLSEGQEVQVMEQLEELHPADIAEIINQIPEEFKLKILRLFDSETQANIISELDEDEREKLLSELTPKEIAETVIHHMESDDAADLISELDDQKKSEVIKALSDLEQANDIIDLLSYSENTAGALMAKELIKVNTNWTVHECIIELRKQAEEVEHIHTVYAIDEQERLIGRLSLKQLILSSPQVIVEEIVSRDIQMVLVSANDVEVVQKMEKYDLVVIPVVDERNRLLGRITIDDVVDLMKEEAEKDYQMASGISDNVEYSDSIINLTKARFPWLLVGLAGGITVAKVIGVFGIIEQTPVLAYFMPLIAAMGGNVGVQSSAIVVQSIANNSVLGSTRKKLLKEFGVGLLNGFLCSVILLLFNLVFNDNLDLSFAVSISLFSVVILAAVLGTWIPLVLHRYKIDPALATGPFITTSNDIIGLLLYFSICQLFL